MIPAISHLCQNIYESTKEKMAGTVPTAVKKVQQFTNSAVGGQVLASTFETVGMSIGAMFPEATIFYSIGQKIAEQMASKTAKAAQKPPQTSSVKIALAATALSIALTYVTGDLAQGSRVLRYLITAAGTIAGGKEGIRMAGGQLPSTSDIRDSYSVRTFQYLVARDAVNFIPVPGFLVPVVKTIVGTLAYYAKPLSGKAIDYYYSEPTKAEIYNPGDFTAGVINRAFGSTTAFAQEMAAQYTGQLPFMGTVLQKIVDEKIASNIFVRSLNRYALILQDPLIQEASKALSNCPFEKPSERAVLQNQLITRIREKLAMGDRGAAAVLNFTTSKKMNGLIQGVVEQLKTTEIQVVGFETSNPERLKSFLEVHSAFLIAFICIESRKGSVDTFIRTHANQLTDNEMKNFYVNMNHLIFTQYGDSIAVKGAEAVMEKMLPLIFQKEGFFMSYATDIIGEGMKTYLEEKSKEPEKSVEEKKSKISTFFSSTKNIFASMWKRFLALFKGTTPSVPQNKNQGS